MPLHVKVYINEHEIETVHIGRIKGGTDPEDINTYKAVLGARPTTVEEWLDGETFEHRYGDMALVCVQKALNALIKGENKHTHEIEVFGAPCLGGDYHEYCNNCDWVEPCEVEGENK